MPIMSERPVRQDFLDEWSHLLRRAPLFHDLEAEELKQIAAKLQPLSLPKGAVVYRENDRADALYFIQSGRVRAVTPDETGSEKILNFLGRGETFGETALLTGTTRTATIKVDSPAHFLVLYKMDFENFLLKNPRASTYLHRVISQRLIIRPKKSMSPSFSPEVLAVMMELPRDEQLAFLANLSFSIKEQTRRRVLLVELGNQGTVLADALGLKPVTSTSSMFRSEDLTNPKILEKISLLHPASGLELLLLPDDIFAGQFQRAVPAFMTVLLEVYDYVLINMSTAKSRPESPGKLDESVRHVLSECDGLIHAHKGNQPPQFRYEDEVPEIPRFYEAILGPLRASSPTKFYVPWNGPANGVAVASGTKKALDRMGRAIGRVQVGLAMGSGAAYGYTLIGMLKIFEREKIPIDYISGTSMGALLGSLSASGKSADEIEEIAHSISKDWLRRNIFRDINWLFHGGLIKGDTISNFLRKHLGDIDFEEFPTPFACAATDIMTGDGVVLREGKVWEAVRASLSLPMIFVPYKIGTKFLVDGGLVNPVPTSIIASMGANILISINLTNKASERRVSLRRVGMFPSSSPGFFNVFFKMIYTMQYQIAAARTDLSHIMIHPETGNFSWIDLHRAKQIIPLGEVAAEEALTKIKSHLPYFSDYCPVPQRTIRPGSF